MNKLKFGLFVDSYYVMWRSPSQINLISLLQEHFELHVFIRNPYKKDLIYLRKNKINFVRQYRYQYIKSVKGVIRYLRKLYCDLIMQISKYFISIDKAICVDPDGERMLLKIYPEKFIQRIHYSLELFVPGESLGASSDGELLPDNYLDDFDFQSLQGLLIQTKERYEVFKNAVNLTPSTNVFYLPVTGTGVADCKKNQYVRNKYSIPKDTFILLYLGGLGVNVQLSELISSFPAFDKYHLFLHGFESDDPSLFHLKKLADQREITNITFSKEMFDNITDIDKIVKSCDVGFFWYAPWCSNMRTAGGSSGKIVSYLKCGLPVIGNKQSGSKSYIQDSGCGIVIESHKELQYALEEILKNYDEYVRATITEYKKTYCFETISEPLIKFLKSE